MRDCTPSYLKLLADGELALRAELAHWRLEECDLCGRRCRVDRLEGTEGSGCRTGERAIVASYGPHHGEEACLSGWRGSGTIFFSRCNLRCVYCQNWDISQKGVGREVSPSEIADMMLELQELGCHNINLVSPSHVVAPILAAVLDASSQGLEIPLVYNSGGYDNPAALELLEGVIDIYMPDMKYGDSGRARAYSGVGSYVEINRAAVREMHRQVGDLVLDDEGIALRGLLVRHLLLPNGIAGTADVLGFLARDISRSTYINVMAQYRPCYRANDFPELSRRITTREYRDAIDEALRVGLERLDECQERWR